MGLPAFKFEAALQTKTCPVCFINYAAPELLFEKKMENGDNWYCPNGHSLVFTETETQKLQKKMERLKADVEWQRGRVAVKERELIAQKGLTTKAKKKLARVDNGVCPECNRTVSQLANHMRTQHGAQCNKPPKGSKVRNSTSAG